MILVLLGSMILGLAWFITTSSSAPTEEEVKAAFIQANPGFVVTNVTATEGDSSASYFEITYTKPNSDTKYKVEWQYLDKGEGSQRLNWKGEEKPISP
jgi:hypothetical protein